MKYFSLIILFPLFAGATNQIEIPFENLAQKIIVKIQKSRCAATGENSYKVETVTPDQEYSLVCKLRPPIDQYDSTTPIRLLQTFEYPLTILEDIEASSHAELKKLGAKAIKKKVRSWGTEYSWATPTYGTEFNTYLCPKKSKHCFKVVHGGIEFLDFEIQKKK